MSKSSVLLCSLVPLLYFSPIQAQLTADSPALALNVKSTDSPLLMREFYPRWSAMDISQAESKLSSLIEEAKKKIDSMTALKAEEMSYATTFGVLERMQEDIDRCFLSVYNLSIVSDSPEVRQVLQDISVLGDQFSADVIANEALWRTVKQAASQPWVKQLDAERARYVAQTLDGFRDSGADLSAEDKKRLAEIRQQLSLLSIQFNKNVLDSTNAWQHVVTDPAQLKGMSENWMKVAAATALEKGYGTKEKPQWLMTLSYSSYGPIMSDCEVEATRKLCWQGASSIGRTGGYKNEGIIEQIVTLRHEMAQLLGFKTYADQTTARRMAQTGERALGFVDDLMAKVKGAFEMENEQLFAFIAERTGQKLEKLQPWDSRYYANELSQQQNNFDVETLRPYFSAKRMIAGMLDLYSDLLGVSFKKIETISISDKAQLAKDTQVEVWHEDVDLYEIYDQKSGKMLGAFYLDIYPRSVKREGAWFLPLRMGESGRNGREAYPNLGVICGNFSPPVNGQDALFSHSEVIVLFHEFGHAMHGLLSDTTLRVHGGTNVAWDFVEMPSQLFEYWVWEPSFLKKHAIHHETGEPLSDEQIQKLRATKYFRPAGSNMGQLNVAKLDLELHMNYDKHFKGRSLDEATAALLAETSIPMTQITPSLMHRLTHCMSGGYGAGYYSYKWAEVLCADAFTRFLKEGVTNPKTGASLRETVLSKGDSKSANELYVDFMGREPNNDALLIEQELLPDTGADR